MATTKSSFVLLTNAQLVGATVQAAGAVEPYNADNAKEIVAGGNGTLMDKLSNLAAAGFAKNAGVALTLTGTTAITLDLTALAAATGVVVGGDTAFATWNSIEFQNTGAADLVVTPGGSNPARLQLGGTSPSLTVAAGSAVLLQSIAGLTVDSTHNTVTITPTTGGAMNITIGGA